MSTSGSVSKGCFAFKGKKKAVVLENYRDPGQKQRETLYQESWSELKINIKDFQTSLMTKIYGDLFDFIQSSHRGFSLLQKHDSHQRIPEIPTAALVTGVNVTDHAAMFKHMISAIKEKISSHVVVLQSKDSTKVKNLLAKLISQLLGSRSDMNSDEEDECDVKIKHVSSSMSVVASWYMHTSKQRDQSPRKSPRKRTAAGNIASTRSDASYKPVVIVLEDLEAFTPSVLQDFLMICSNHLHEIPIVLVFGIATTVSSVHRLLPHSVSSLLCLEKFQAPPSTDYLKQMLNEVVMTNRYPFKLGARVFQLLLDIFLCHDFSVDNYLTGLQFSMMEHFSANPASIICCHLTKSKEIVRRMTDKQLDDIRALTSYRKLVEDAKSMKERQLLLLDSTHTKNTIVQLSEELDLYHRCFFPVLHCLNILTSGLPKQPLGKQLRELYCLTLLNNVYEMQEFQDSMTLLRTMSRDELLESLKKCITRLEESDLPDEIKQAYEELQNIVHKLENIEDLAEVGKDINDIEEGNDISALPKKTDMSTLKQKLKEMHKKKKKLTVYEQLRNDGIAFVENLVQKHLVCYRNYTLYEAFYYDQSSIIKRHLAASPRASIHTGLGNPHYYLPNDELKCDGGHIALSLPDICIVYKLHLECGRLINLYDWLQAFITIISGDEESSNAKKPDPVLQARFIRAVSELQFLGFIKPTKRKTDHVARLTWGGC
ncbi:origin recognition complex subunit 3-like [Tubulanus polymorphus]|uniref:origin recognition complex subunit 3-like n=1 Tax=Tubulanus polymorphus TaxID=672921 RepID=UPI003DA4A4C5